LFRQMGAARAKGRLFTAEQIHKTRSAGRP
jgi:hypothetical protein